MTTSFESIVLAEAQAHVAKNLLPLAMTRCDAAVGALVEQMDAHEARTHLLAATYMLAQVVPMVQAAQAAGVVPRGK